MALADSEIPAELLKVRNFIAETFNGGNTRDIWVNTADHEQLSEGAYSIALEGAYEWPILYQELRYEGKAPDPKGWYLECKNGWCLAAYPEHQETDEEFDDYLWERPAYME